MFESLGNLGSLTSLTGGGGFTPSSSAGAYGGDQDAGSSVFGSLNYNSNQPWLLVGLAAVVVVVLLKK